MTAARRVAAVEASLNALDIVLHVIAEAHEFAGLDAYARSIAEQPIEAAPLTRIIEQAEASVRAAMKGRPREEVDAAVRKAVGDAFFRFVLFLRINLEAHDLADRHGVLTAALFFWMGCLLSGPRETDLKPEEWAAHEEEQRHCWRQWRLVLANVRLKVIVEDDAREQLEARYLGGRPSLLAEDEKEWDEFADQVERLWSLGEQFGPEGVARPEPELADAERILDQQIAERVQTIADDARVSTFERLGDLPRAVEIIERRLLG